MYRALIHHSEQDPSEARLKLDFNHEQPSTESGELMKLMGGGNAV